MFLIWKGDEPSDEYSMTCFHVGGDRPHSTGTLRCEQRYTPLLKICFDVLYKPSAFQRYIFIDIWDIILVTWIRIDETNFRVPNFFPHIQMISWILCCLIRSQNQYQSKRERSSGNVFGSCRLHEWYFLNPSWIPFWSVRPIAIDLHSNIVITIFVANHTGISNIRSKDKFAWDLIPCRSFFVVEHQKVCINHMEEFFWVILRGHLIGANCGEDWMNYVL